MSELLSFGLLFLVSLTILIKASDFFTDAAEKVGIIIGLPPFIVGVTIVSIGTSLPELGSSIVAVLQDSSEIVIGNVVGSNITNIFLVIGIASIIAKKIRINYDLVYVDLPLFAGSAFLLGLMVFDNKLSSGEAVLLLLAYIMYLFYIVKTSTENEEEASRIDYSIMSKGLIKECLIIILSCLGLYLGAKYTISSLIKISEIINIGKEILAITAVALGTSLPELIVTVNSAMKGQGEMAVGNVLGSNIFNSFMVMGIPGLIGNLVIPNTIIAGGIPTMIAGTILLFFATQDKRLTIWEGWLFLSFYVLFIGNSFKLL